MVWTENIIEHCDSSILSKDMSVLRREREVYIYVMPYYSGGSMID